MISSISCRNFRSLEEVDLELGRLTAIVGPNGTGKTSILRSLDIVLGSAWPSLRSFRVPQDFTRFDPSRDLSITAGLDVPLVHEHALGKANIYSLRVRCQPYKRKAKGGDVGDLHCEFEPLGKKGKPVQVPIADRRGEFRFVNVSTGMRDQARILLIDHRRSLVQHLPSTRGSVLGRLFEPARKEFERVVSDAEESPKELFRKRYEAAMDALRTDQIREIERTIGETTKRTLGFLGSRALEDIEVGFGFADPANPFNSLRLQYREGNLAIPGEELGLGVQSAMVVGIFEAMRQLGGGIGTVVIEEPEMYLHPQAQRYFYNLLVELAESGGCQVIYSTHSAVFTDITRFEAIRLVRKESGGMSKVSLVRDPDDAKFLSKRRDLQKLITAFDTGRNEMFFARRVLLVEGEGDQLAVREVTKRLGVDLNAEDLSVIACGSKTAIPFFARTCRALDIPVVVLHDEDILSETGTADQIAKIKKENERSRKENEDIQEALSNPSLVFAITPSLEGMLGIGRRARDKPKLVVERLSQRSTEDFPGDLVNAVRELLGKK